MPMAHAWRGASGAGQGQGRHAGKAHMPCHAMPCHRHVAFEDAAWHLALRPQIHGLNLFLLSWRCVGKLKADSPWPLSSDGAAISEQHSVAGENTGGQLA